MLNQSSGGIYYGWFIVAASVFISMVGMGAVSGFGVFIIPMSEDFDWSRSTISVAASVAALVGGTSQPFMGRLFDRIGGRKMMTAGLLVFGLANILLVFTTNIIYLVLVFGVLMALGNSAGTMNTAAALASKWFQRKRATAVSIVSSGGSLGGLVLVPFVAFVIPLAGWRSTWLILGIIVLVLAVPLAFFIIRDDPRDIGKLPDGIDEASGGPGGTAVPRGPLEVEKWAEAFRSIPFWQLAGGYFVCGITTTMMSTHFVPYAVEEGFSSSTAATAFGTLSALNIIGVLGAGILGDRLGRKNVLAAIYALRGVAYLVLLTVPGIWGLFGFAVIGGFSWLATVPLTTVLTAEVYGLRNVGILTGVVFMAHQIGGAGAIQLSGIMRDVTGSYTVPFAVAGLCLIFASIVSFAIQERKYSSRYQVAAEAVAD